MEWYRRYADRVTNLKLFKAGFLGTLVFDALCDLSGEHDLGGEIPPEHQDLEWLARRMQLDRACEDGVFWSGDDSDPARVSPVSLIQKGLEACQKPECGLIRREPIEPDSDPLSGRGEIWVIVGWEERQPKTPTKSTLRVLKHRAKLDLKRTETRVKREKKKEKQPETDIERREGENVSPVSRDENAPSPLTPEGLQDAWNALAHAELPRWRGMSDGRTKAAKARIEEHPDWTYWQEVFDKINASRFCRGENDRGWRASPDWLLQPDSSIRALEGKYDGKPEPRGRAPAPPVRHLGPEHAPEEIPF